MKKIITSLFLLISVFSVAGCSKDDPWNDPLIEEGINIAKQEISEKYNDYEIVYITESWCRFNLLKDHQEVMVDWQNLNKSYHYILEGYLISDEGLATKFKEEYMYLDGTIYESETAEDYYIMIEDGTFPGYRRETNVLTHSPIVDYEGNTLDDLQNDFYRGTISNDEMLEMISNGVHRLGISFGETGIVIEYMTLGYAIEQADICGNMDLYYRIPTSIYGIPVSNIGLFRVDCAGCNENDEHGDIGSNGEGFANVIFPKLPEMTEIICPGAKNIFFEGSKEDLEVPYDTTYYYSETEPTEEGNYWYYDSNNNPVIW